MSIRYLTSLDLESFISAARAVPYQGVNSDLFPGVEVWIRRDDLLDPLISGNKAYKLFYNLLAAKEQGADTIITCGGAWSNHIHATAAAGARFGLRTMGIIRGERPPLLSATLQDAERFGMQLKFVTRELYRQRNRPEFLELAELDAINSLYVPEGGANLAGAEGIRLLGEVIERTAPISFDQLWVACGTGLTLGSLASSVHRFPVHGVEVLRAGDSIRRDAEHWIAVLGTNRDWRKGSIPTKAFELTNKYHCGGYAKYPNCLREFQQDFEQQSGIPLDPVYTAKLMYAVSQEAIGGRISRGARILVLHSGGLQGRRGFQPRK
ncbi:1-aminocyclopropane-1-carboxylate deaminase/D-cysteine desulfhydrase [Microbulbifer donghaiensis]|uniref:1-aminocyclopropane-1-carboxylate deaminase/D-cysteine desulfhydrase n=1 Tax=Microbulbifer donghaiensis TaxID=494016 RepID=UPI0013565516|nr:pyridoxal-phosphate dependent enzyme [Microbulbifer donghaiensis]